MNNRHTFPRKAPPNQRPPDSKGWGREQDGGVTIWNLWAPTNDRLRIVSISVTVSKIEIALGGRHVAAMRLREARKKLKQAL